jgi:hypothetical protein
LGRVKHLPNGEREGERPSHPNHQRHCTPATIHKECSQMLLAHGNPTIT